MATQVQVGSGRVGDGRGSQPQGGDVAGQQDRLVAECCAEQGAWARQGRTLAKPSVSLTRDELQVLLAANWRPFFAPNGRPYGREAVERAKSSLIGNVEDSGWYSTLLDESRYDEVKAALLRKVGALNDDEARHLVRVMDGYWYNCQELAVEDFFAVAAE